MTEERLNIRQFKMLNGEEIIGLVNQKETNSYIIERPFRILPNMIGGFTLLPWFPFSSQKLFKIGNKFIMHHVEIDEDMKTEYIKLASAKPKLAKPALARTDSRELLQEFEEFLEEEVREEFDFDHDFKKNKVLH
jgi:hypothetical protein